MWPDSLDSGSGTVNICVVGDDPDKSISSMEEKTVMDRPINVVVSPFASGIDIKSCDVLFISKSKSDSLEDILAMISDESGESLPILTISDIDDFVMRGGMVSLLFVDNKLRIEINNKAAKAANIRIKSDLMSLSRKTIN